jgi:hypothetical protein
MSISKTAFFLSLIFFLGCWDDSPPKVDPDPVDPVEKEVEPTKMIVNIDHLRMRTTPGEKGEEVTRLKKGTVLFDLGEVSEFTTRIQLRGIWFDEPWLKVKTQENLEGWVYGGAVTYDMENPTELASKMMEKRLQTFFGKGLTLRLNRYKTNYDSLKTSNDFATNLKEGLELRDTLTTILENRINVGDNYNQMPDLFWIENAIPGYVTQLVAEGTIYYLFQDFRQLKQKSQITDGSEDDDFVDLNLLVFSADSVEHFFPAWFIQTWDYGGCSLLGKGEHFKILSKANEILNKSTLFKDEIIDIKNRLVDDITGKDVDYWEEQEKILVELDSIMASGFSVLTNEDMIALKTRRMQFEYPVENKIKVNVRSGEVY